jgi:CheY-like chemotaxis protein
MAAILIVDDDPSVRMIATEMLRGTGHAIVEAEDGVEALGLMEHIPIDLLVLDMLMPNMDGIETIRAVRRKHPEARVLAISSGGRSDAEGYLKLALAFGADAVMEKPLRLVSFASVIELLLKQRAVRNPIPTHGVSSVG